MSLLEKLIFDERLYDASVLQKAAYRNIAFVSVEIRSMNDAYECMLRPNIDVSEVEFRTAVQEFKKDVLDYQLRLKLQAETEPVRNLILGLAFSKTGLSSE